MSDYEHDFSQGGEPIVYVGEIRPEDLPDEVRAHVRDDGHIYAIRTENGQVLGLTDDRNHAFAVARRNALQPVSVH